MTMPGIIHQFGGIVDAAQSANAPQFDIGRCIADLQRAKRIVRMCYGSRGN
jgi:hypothetical protein